MATLISLMIRMPGVCLILYGVVSYVVEFKNGAKTLDEHPGVTYLIYGIAYLFFLTLGNIIGELIIEAL